MINLQNYSIYRRDRGSKGGGVLIAIRKTISSQEIPLNVTDELIAVILKFSKNYFVKLVLAYNPLFQNVKNLKSLLKNIRSIINKNEEVILMGDFNIPNFSLDESSSFINTKPQYKLLSSFVSKLQPLSQVVNFPTRGENTLDLIFSRRPTLITDIQELPSIGKSDHSVIIGNYNLRDSYKNKIQKDLIKNFDLADYFQIKNFFKNLKFFKSKNYKPEELWNEFQNLMNFIISNFVPTTVFYFKNRTRLSHRHIHLYQRMKRMYKKWKKSGNEDCKAKYLKFKSDFRKYIYKTQILNETNLIHDSNPKRLFNYFNSKKYGKEPIIRIKTETETETEDPSLVSNIFNKFFISIFGNASNKFNIANKNHYSNQHDIFDEKFIKLILVRLKNKSYRGPDGIPTKFYSNLSNELSPLLTKMFNLFYNFSYIPFEWKSVYVKPLYKKQGAKNLCTNYRPISLTNSLLRVFETAIKIKLIADTESQISTLQHGFVKGRSTLSNLVNTYYYIYKQLNENNPIDMVCIDFSKAFDRVPFNLLLAKLKNLNLDSRMVRIVRELLVDRKQYVKLDRALSLPLNITSGVPQGSPLSPILFSIFINDLLTKKFVSKLLAFADDIKIFGPPGNGLVSDLQLVSDWAKENEMIINIGKCNTIHFLCKKNPGLSYAIDGVTIPSADVVRDLGLLVDSGLSFNLHIQKLTLKTFKLINLIFRKFHVKDISIYLRFFKIYILPIIFYGFTVYFPKTRQSITELEKIQKYFSKRLFLKINSKDICPPYSERLQLFNLETIESLCVKHDLRVLFNSTHGLFSVDFLPEISTRSPERFIFQRCGSKNYRNSFFHRSLVLWNKLISPHISTSPLDIHTLNSLLSDSSISFNFGSTF